MMTFSNSSFHPKMRGLPTGPEAKLRSPFPTAGSGMGLPMAEDGRDAGETARVRRAHPELAVN